MGKLTLIAADLPTPPPTLAERAKGLVAKVKDNAKGAAGVAALALLARNIYNVIAGDENDRKKAEDVFLLIYKAVRGGGAVGGQLTPEQIKTFTEVASEAEIQAALDGIKREVLTATFTKYIDP